MLQFQLFAVISLQFLFISGNSAGGLYSKFHQTDYKIEFQRLVLLSYDKSMCNHMDIRTYKFNRTFPAFNASFNFKKDFGTKLEIVIQLYKFLSNEYRIFPTRFEINFCKALNENIIGSAVAYKCGNFTTCTVMKDTTYKICNAYLDESRFPPLFPSGEFKVSCEFEYESKNVFTMEYYMKVYRPIT